MYQHGLFPIQGRRGLRPLLLLGILLGAVVPLGVTDLLPTGGQVVVTGAQTIGLVSEVLLLAPLRVRQTAPSAPPPLENLEDVTVELVADGVWLPGWLPPDVRAGPVVIRHVTVTGDQVIVIHFQVLRAGQVLPVMIVQLLSEAGRKLTYASAPPDPAAYYGVAGAQPPVEGGRRGRATGGPQLRRASYWATAVGQNVAQGMVIPGADGTPTLHGLLWQVGTRSFYVGGYLPLNEVRKIARGLSPVQSGRETPWNEGAGR